MERNKNTHPSSNYPLCITVTPQIKFETISYYYSNIGMYRDQIVMGTKNEKKHSFLSQNNTRIPSSVQTTGRCALSVKSFQPGASGLHL